MTATEYARDLLRGQTRSNVLPERLPVKLRWVLFAGDALVIFFVSLVTLSGGSGSRVAAALLTAAILCGVFWGCGLYARSYAVHARDEIYYACAGVAFAAVPVWIVLAAIGEIPAVSISLALFFSIVGTSAWHARAHLERRAAAPAAGIASISPRAWLERESTWFLLARRAFDLTGAVLILIAASPVMIAAALAIALESGKPVFFRQERVGRDGRTFRIWKFRTMRNDAGSAWARPGDDRITRTGALLRRTSIDELPQLFNVLRGEMSLVGPRPEMIAFAKEFSQRLPAYAQRHVVTPGLTGWAQLYLERNLDPNDVPRVLPYDLFYVEHASPLLDAALALKTAAEILFHRAV